MLSRSLRDDIELTLDMPEDLWPVMVDPTELELALLNIGVNARDAMPNGGRLCVEAQNVSFPPDGTVAGEKLIGDFVALTLLDTGTGMAPEVGYVWRSPVSRNAELRRIDP
jgi:signal transduction histidine kinase